MIVVRRKRPQVVFAKRLQLSGAKGGNRARLRRDHGKPAAARDLLAPIYDGFAGGFDTPDLKDAKAPLDELA